MKSWIAFTPELVKNAQLSYESTFLAQIPSDMQNSRSRSIGSARKTRQQSALQSTLSKVCLLGNRKD
jgi:hypothetical protein